MSSKFFCQHCRKRFSSNFVLRRHVKNFHNAVGLPSCERRGPKPKDAAEFNAVLECSICACEFLSRQALARHKRTKHKAKGPPNSELAAEQKLVSPSDNVSNMPQMGEQKYFESLVGLLHKFRESDFLCDTVLVTDDRHELKAHSVVLAAASSVFQAAFQAAADRGPGMLQVNLREYSGEVVEIALHFIYTGKLPVLPKMFSKNDEFVQLISVLERLGLDVKLLNSSLPCFAEEDTSNLTEKQMNIRVSSVVELDDDVHPLSEDSKNQAEKQTKPKEPGMSESRKYRSAKLVSNQKDATADTGTSLENSSDSVDSGAAFSSEQPVNDGEKDDDNIGLSSVDVENVKKLRVDFVCDKCGRSFAKKERLQLHERTHTGERPYACETCGRRFALIGNLRRHLPMHSENKPFMCELCGRSFIRKVYLEDHLAVHRTAHPYVCSVCSKGFNSAGQLRVHQRCVHEPGDTCASRAVHPCDICGKSFSSRSNLKTHSRLHTGERPFVCACGKAYSQRVQLLQHMRVHSDERPFQCEFCKRSFRFRGSLIVHVRSHTGERPHVCEHCGKSYTNRSSLRVHRARMHGVSAGIHDSNGL